jgi:hypothetical protein
MPARNEYYIFHMTNLKCYMENVSKSLLDHIRNKGKVAINLPLSLLWLRDTHLDTHLLRR